MTIANGQIADANDVLDRFALEAEARIAGDAANAAAIAGISSALVYTPAAFNPAGTGTALPDGGTLGDGNAHPASANGFTGSGALAALQAAFPLTQAATPGNVTLASDMAGLMIQESWNTAHANGGGTAFTPAGAYRNLPHGLTYPEFSNIEVRGAGWATAILCQNCGTNPGISCLQQNDSSRVGGRVPFKDFALWGLDTYTINLHNTGGAPNTTIFNPGTRGIWFQSAAQTLTQGVEIVNFDLATDWEGGHWTGVISGTTLTVSGMAAGATITRQQFFQKPDGTLLGRITGFNSGTGGNGTYTIIPLAGDQASQPMTGLGGNYIMTFRDCAFMFDNKGAVINVECFNSFEKMIWDTCNLSGNNYGVFVNFTDSLVAGGVPGAADAHVLNCSIDYNSVQQIFYLGGASSGGGDLICSYEQLGGHIETDSTATGTQPRISNDGYMTFNSVDFFENGPNIAGWIATTGQTCATKVIGCNLPGFNFPDTSAACMPLVINPGSMGYISGASNTNRIPFGVLLGRDVQGDVSGYENDTPLLTFGIINADQTLSLRHQRGKPITVINTCTITLPADSVTNWAIGSSMEVTVITGATLTMARGSGVNPIDGYTVPVVGPARRQLSKIASNTYAFI